MINPHLKKDDLVNIIRHTVVSGLAGGDLGVWKVNEVTTDGVNEFYYWIKPLGDPYASESMISSADDPNIITWTIVNALQVGDEVEIFFCGNKSPNTYRVVEILTEYYRLSGGAGWSEFLLPHGNPDYTWNIISHSTLPSIPVAKPITGSTCRRCDVFNDFAEPDATGRGRTHLCFGCKQDGYGQWGDK